MAESEYGSICATCKVDLRNAIAKTYLADALIFQLETDQVIWENHGMYFGMQISAKEWFEVAHFFVTLIRRTNRSGTDGLMSLMNHMNVVLPKETPKIAGAGIELLRVHDRQQVFASAWRFLSATEERLEEALKESGLTRQGFCDKDELIPIPLIELVESLTNKPVTRTKRIKPCSSSPRSREEVIRMMEKLKRKLEMARR
jgi:hypothetical protein